MKRSIFSFAVLFLLAFGSCVTALGCSGGGSVSNGPPPENSEDKQEPAPPPETISVQITNNNGDDFHVTAETAYTAGDRATGLMNRPSMDADDGMIFFFKEETNLSFWMKNTLIPLDMLFINANKQIVDINFNAQPQDTTPYQAKFPAKYVLEVNGGYADEHNIRVGDRVSFDGSAVEPYVE